MLKPRVAKWVLETIQPFIDHRQYGNQKGMSTTHCLIDVYHHMVSGAEKAGNVCTHVLTDYTKAFDMIDRRIAVINLLKMGMMGMMGVSPAIVEWVIDFLSSRKQRVKYKQTFSEWVTLSGDVPQGTNMGPITFLAIVINYALNDVQHTNNRVWKYVDDLTIGENRAYSDDSSIQDNLDAL
ncbi:uncharacterized protein [Amphiura filiformis]|uniref:uncharacterized protein n=1 Tax=Amphiura filiformis TaxID=82378 RepID=UPI003B2222A7